MSRRGPSSGWVGIGESEGEGGEAGPKQRTQL